MLQPAAFQSRFAVVAVAVQHRAERPGGRPQGRSSRVVLEASDGHIERGAITDRGKLRADRDVADEARVSGRRRQVEEPDAGLARAGRVVVVAAEQLVADAIALQDAGASLLVLEAIPTALADRVTKSLLIPTIGIGAGPACSGQVLVMHDMLGVFPGHRPKFVKNFMEDQPDIAKAISAYVRAVKDGSFPGAEHCF